MTSAPSSPELAPIDPSPKPKFLSDTKAAGLHGVLERHRGDRLLVLIQDFPDPDALSSAWALRLIAQGYRIDCDLVYAGTLSHQENIALVKLTGLPAQRWTPQSLKGRDWSVYSGCVLVDTQGDTSQLLDLVVAAQIPIVAIFDHHHGETDLPVEFLDLRPQVRATATILTQYLQAGLLEMNADTESHIKCATALMHGLRSDTQNLQQAREEDFQAAAYLSRFYDAQLLGAILRSSRSKRVMDVIEHALRNRQVQNNFCVAGVGYLRYEDRDAIPQAADFLVSEENVHTALVYGIVHDEDDQLELVVGSLRTSKITLDPDEFLKEAFGQDPQGRFFGGGRAQAGGFEIPVGFLSGNNDQADFARLKWEAYDSRIKQKLQELVNPLSNPLQA